MRHWEAAGATNREPAPVLPGCDRGIPAGYPRYRAAAGWISPVVEILIMGRRNVKIAGFVFSACFLFNALVWAADGYNLLLSCQEAVKHDDGEEDADIEKAGLCTGYVRGVYSTLYAFQDVLPPKLKICFPNEWMEAEQLTNILLAFLKDHPDQLYAPDTALIYSAFKAAFPCKK
jgi:hypothetical protein